MEVRMANHVYRVTEIRGQVADGQVAHFQVGLKLGFRLEDGD
ncbi:MAG: Dodecin, partial [Pseudonocardiales bacterium]|nr:Dodecin [Pseudonocardiales bacterium]